MFGRNYINLYSVKNMRFYYRDDLLKQSKEELVRFLEWDKNMDSLEFAKKMMYSHELKANNQVEGYQDDIELIEGIVKRKIENIKDVERKMRILNLYKGYYYILHHKKIDEEHLLELYNILSNGLLSMYDIENMGEKYREAKVYILQNGRLDMEFDEGIDYQLIPKYMAYYFNFINNISLGDDLIDEYLKSQIMHFYFVYIHPFFDVNGRTSRTMAMWYLLKKQAYPYIIFNRGISFKGSTYDKIITKTKEKLDLTIFLEFMLDTLKLELEKEHIMEDIAKNTTYKLGSIDYQTILYFLTMNGNKTLADFARFYNNLNDKKKISDIYREMIEPLIDAEIFKVVRYTQKQMGNINNIELELNPNKYELDTNYLKRIKIK